MDICRHIEAGKYNYKPYPEFGNYDLTKSEYDPHNQKVKEKFISDIEEVLRYNTSIGEKFKKDLIESFELSEHPKAEKAFRLAWIECGYLGYEEVYYYFAELADLMKD